MLSLFYFFFTFYNFRLTIYYLNNIALKSNYSVFLNIFSLINTYRCLQYFVINHKSFKHIIFQYLKKN